MFPISFMLRFHRLFKFIFTFNLCMCEFGTCVWVSTEIVTGYQIPCDWNSQVFINHPVSVLGIEPQSFGVPTSTLNHLTSSKAPHELYFTDNSEFGFCYVIIMGEASEYLRSC